MFTTIIVGVDGRDGGRDALELARRLAGPSTRIVVTGIATGATNLAAAQTAVGSARQRAPLASEVTRVASSVGVGLAEVAQAESADLVVVGACHHGPIGRFLLGDDAADAVREIDVPVAIAPRDYRVTPEAPITHIVVGVDGSAAASTARTLAEKLGQEHDAQVDFVEAVAYPWEMVEVYPYTARQVPAADFLGVAQQQVREREGDGAIAEIGSPVSVLRQEGDHADLIVVGHAARSQLASMFEGVTGARVAASCRCPVMVVPE